MKYCATGILGLLVLAGCASQTDKLSPAAVPPPAPQNIDWEKVDKSTARTKERQEKGKAGWKKTETELVESGYLPMTEEEYESALATAVAAVRKENPKLSDSEAEEKARLRADEAKRQYESSYRTRTTTSVKWTSP